MTNTFLFLVLTVGCAFAHDLGQMIVIRALQGFAGGVLIPLAFSIIMTKLPPSIGAADPLKIKLRVLMTPEGKLAAAPVLIEASASAKGPLLMQGAISALEACQPYAMLPLDRYGEWKALDLSFTPEDFSGE